jgi:hypothetical protein
MPNAIKYNVSAETLALKKGNFWIGTGDVGKGPTSSTGFYNGITPPTGGFTIYLNKSSGGPSIYAVTTEAQMVSLTNSIGSQNFTTSGQCLNWFATQTDKMIFNRDYEGIITNGLVLNLDAGFTPSYSQSGTTWYDVSSSGNNGALINGPTFNSSNGGVLIFDGTDDYVNIPNNNVNYATGDITVESFVKPVVDFAQYGMSILIQGTSCVQCSFSVLWGRTTNKFSWFSGDGIVISTSDLLSNNWYHIVGVRRSDGTDLYVNGELNATTTTVGNGTGNSTSLSIGESITCSVVPNWNGNIGIVRLYNKSLTSTEILQNYNAQKGRYGL